MQRLTLKGTGKGLCNLPPGPFQICPSNYIVYSAQGGHGENIEEVPGL